MADTSTKPYLIRAIHEWCTDNGYTPYLAVAVDSRTIVPREHVRNGEIVLNVSVMATHKLSLGNEFVEFQARFGGVARELSIPVENVTAVYARENGHGMAFDVPKAPAVSDEDAPTDAPAGGDASATPAIPPSAGAPAARRAPPRRRGPRLVPIDGDGGADGSDAAAPADAPSADATEAAGDVRAVEPAASAPVPPVTAPAADASPADETGKGPDDRGPAPGRPRLTRIK